MADKNGLGILGFIFAGVTAAVMLTAALVVHRHIDGRMALDERQLPVVEISASRAAR
jgi:hypothetical protein